MSKNFIFKLCGYIIILLAPIFWLLKVLMPAQFGWYNLSFAVGFMAAGIGLLIILNAIFSSKNTVLKKLNIFIGGGLGIVAVVCFVSAFAFPKNIIAPIICIILAGCLLLGLVVTGGKKWDEGDNNKVGYKTYHQRTSEAKQNNQNTDNQ